MKDIQIIHYCDSTFRRPEIFCELLEDNIGHVSIRDNHKPDEDLKKKIKISEEKINAFWKAVDEIKVWTWTKDKTNQHVRDGWCWDLKLKKKGQKRSKIISALLGSSQDFPPVLRLMRELEKLFELKEETLCVEPTDEDDEYEKGDY